MKKIKENILLLIELSKSDLKRRFSGSILSLFWIIASPLISIGVIVFIFEVGFREFSSTGVGENFTLWLLCGLIPWFFFSETLISATSSFFEYSYLVKKIKFQISLIPLIKIVSGTFVHIFFVILLLLFTLSSQEISPNMLLIIYYSFALAILISSFSIITSILSVFVRDVKELIISITQIMFWLTPIVWDISTVNEDIRQILFLNPIYYVIHGYRTIILPRTEYSVETGIFNSTTYHVYFWLTTIILLIVSHILFKRSRKHLVDLL